MNPNEHHGRRNLIILGVSAISIAIITSAIELWIYRSSGDIYLDRSRPGYLPDIDEAKEDAGSSSNYTYPENGSLDVDELQKYLNAFKEASEHLDKIDDPYSPDSLSDESLGIFVKSSENQKD